MTFTETEDETLKKDNQDNLSLELFCKTVQIGVCNRLFAALGV